MKEKRQKKENNGNAVKFSIGAKLVIIITILVLVSLGTITFLVSYLVREDMQITAEENNFEVNRRTAAEAEYTLTNVHSSALVLMQIINAAGAESELAKQAAGFFFDRNRHIAALQFPVQGQDGNLLINERFFFLQEIDDSLVNSFYENNSGIIERSAIGETIFLNATAHFDFHLLALFFPVHGGGGAVSILFSPEHLSNSFNSGINQSFLLNGDGDVLVHPDFELVRTAANMANRGFIRSIRENPARNRQDLYDDEGKRYFIAYTKLDTSSSIAVTSIEYNKIFEGIAATTRRNLYLTAAVLSLSILFIWFFSKTISVTLKSLAKAASKIEEGIFEIDLEPKGNDEISYLTSSFLKMSAALGIFGRFTNREIAVKAMRGEIKPGGLPKHATVFFSDIRGFTEKSENFTNMFGSGASDKIVHWLNEYFTHMIECVEKTSGVVDKFIGDAVMAHWGTAYSAGSPAKDAYNCVKAALMMRVALHILNKKRRSGDPGNPPINIGCGINTGIVTAGQLGSDLRMEYTVIGDPVNLASRIESLNKPLGTDILISEDTWNLVKYQFITEEMPSVTVKGKEKPVRLFAVVNHVSVTSGPKTLAEVRELLGIKPPDVSNADINSEEKKYKIGAAKKQ
ncbi:MAG: adenylate/guanylate cyclase domain-containing protein [Treponema sp.]|jgi:adenylate cyclase|nr:adenylate/guanylate cyclase domain-containing protein [Treponema sp.]